MNKKEIIFYDIYHNSQNIPFLQIIHQYHSQNGTKYTENNGIVLLSNGYNIGSLEIEHVFAISINNNGEIIGIINIGVGNDVHSEINQKKLCEFLILTGANKFVVYHNHPNNVIRPSEDDIMSKLQFETIGRWLDIECLGSYILGTDKYCEVDDNVKDIR